MPGRQISVVVADDHPVVLEGLKEFLNREPDLCVVASCLGGMAALEAIRTQSPQVALLDVCMPDLSGLAVLAKLAEERSATKVILLTASITPYQQHSAAMLGARGLILKDAALNDLPDKIRQVVAGATLFAGSLVETAGPAPGSPEQMLTRREREVMLLASEGLSNKHVARKLGLTEGTVKLHLHHIFQKMGVANRTALAARRSLTEVA